MLLPGATAVAAAALPAAAAAGRLDVVNVVLLAQIAAVNAVVAMVAAVLHGAGSGNLAVAAAESFADAVVVLLVATAVVDAAVAPAQLIAGSLAAANGSPEPPGLRQSERRPEAMALMSAVMSHAGVLAVVGN